MPICWYDLLSIYEKKPFDMYRLQNGIGLTLKTLEIFTLSNMKVKLLLFILTFLTLRSGRFHDF